VDYVIIIPAYNEVDFLPRVIASISAQTLRPRQLVLVDDDSTDGTGALIDTYAAEHDWITAVHRSSEQKGHSGGAKVVAAFYSGYAAITAPYEFLVKLDADCELPPHYFARIADIFTADPGVGIAGGQLTTYSDGEWRREDIADQGHVLGAVKSWRKACFADIGGLRYTIGWDSLDEMLAQFHGWRVGFDPDLLIRHHRPIHTHTGLARVHRRIGRGLYKSRFGWWVTGFSAIKAGLRTPHPIRNAWAVLAGFLAAWRERVPFVVTPEEGRFFRRLRWTALWRKLRKSITG
jgi:glycosyltransferase involved in cell wall biosynthesis